MGNKQCSAEAPPTGGARRLYLFSNHDRQVRHTLRFYPGTPAAELEAAVKVQLGIPASERPLVYLDTDGERVVLR